MNSEDLLGRVRRHYQATEKPLLLSDFGKELRNAGLWPVQGEKRSLAEALVEVAPELVATADPDSKAYVVVTEKADADRAARAFTARRHARLLKRLPRSVLLAFCAKAEGKSLFLGKEPPHRYALIAEPADRFWPIDARYRLPGMYIDANRLLADADADRLTANIVASASEQGVDLDALTLADKGDSAHAPVPSPVPARHGKRSRTAPRRAAAGTGRQAGGARWTSPSCLAGCRNVARDRRAAVRGHEGPELMIVLAGLPPAVYTSARAQLERPGYRVLGAPSGAGDGALYPGRIVDLLLRSSAESASAEGRKAARPPIPAS